MHLVTMKQMEVPMNSTVKRIVGAVIAASMACALVPATPVRAEEDLPEWARDPDYHEVTLLQPQEDLPAQFDLRDKGVVTPVKQQNPWASCWAFAGIAAAETSIISDLGAPADLDLSEKHLAWFGMHPVKEVDAGDQAGEGITVFAEATDGGNAVYIPSNPVLVSTLFSIGMGPVFEGDTEDNPGFPYRGKEGMTDLDALVNYKPEWKDYRKKELIKVYGSEEKVLEEIKKLTGFTTIDEYLDAEIAGKIERIVAGQAPNCYSGIDDWSIPDTDESGDSNRNLFAGYTLRHGNVLPELITVDAAGKWTGVNQLGMQAVKQELMDGHGVSISFCADTSAPNQKSTSQYISLTNWAHYTYEKKEANHGVCIVGWDDDYPAANFTHNIEGKDNETAAQLSTPPGNGAWICKNSWGCSDGCGTAVYNETQILGKNDWGVVDEDGKHTGYFYISYYDQSLDGPETLEFDDDLEGDEFTSHTYDYLPATIGFFELFSQNVMSSANIFTAGEDEQVVSVSTRSTKPNSRVTFALYRLNDGAQSPIDGTLVETQSYDIEFKGFHRFDLTEPLKVRKGERFSIVSTVSHMEGDERRYDVCASCSEGKDKAEKNKSTYYGTAVVNKGESAFFMEGKWYDWHDYQQQADSLYQKYINGNVADNFSIKAYALSWDGDEMHRLYNPNSGEHFYTASTVERDRLVELGWKYEGVGWVAPAGGDPVYRLYNKYAGDHHYTTSEQEKDALVDKHGWTYEGVGWCSAPAESGVPLYRQYNPNAKAGSHNYTTSEQERDTLVGKHGWHDEGIGWYGVKQ